MSNSLRTDFLRETVCSVERQKPRRFPLTVLGLGLLFSVQSAIAQNWDTGPIFEAGVIYDDNPRLQDDAVANSDSGALLNLGLDMRRLTERSSIQFRPQVDIRRYSDDSDADSEDILLKFSAVNNGLKNQWRLGLDYSQEQVLRGEVPTADFDDPRLDDDFTGTLGVRERRERDKLQIRPGATFNLSERLSLDVNLYYMDIQYDSQSLGTAIDFSTASADVSISRRFTEDSDFEIGLFTSEYETDANFNKTTTSGLRGRYSKTVTENSTLYVEAGVQDSDIKLSNGQGGTTTNSERGALVRAGWDKRWVRSRLRLAADHGQSSSGSGFLVERSQLRAGLDRQLTERWTMRLSGVMLNSKTLGLNNVQVAEIDFFEATAGLTYDLTRKWSLRGNYVFTSRDEKSESGSQESNGVTLSVAYTPEFQTR